MNEWQKYEKKKAALREKERKSGKALSPQEYNKEIEKILKELKL